MEQTEKKILIIDDDSRNIFALTAILKSRGFIVFSAASAQEGIEMLLQNKSIKAVLMDMMMPEMDGYEAIGYIRNKEEISHIPIIAVTAQAMVGDKEKCLEAGANDYISKPIDVDALLKVLANY
ncbi:response regulator [Xanthocytophaga agilis]|uniref:Response regulator n=1 Tax=Xanthocytophaga agilis TaxID=3048010 RepID=A0AAE3UDP2_9BACT|nr:response regulator [Xanthocytophaga agilis]MDJ1501435.1 response regulator [Xanthocytophaga agilis]